MQLALGLDCSRSSDSGISAVREAAAGVAIHLRRQCSCLATLHLESQAFLGVCRRTAANV